jgi:predicted transcriptional regulator
MTFLFTLSTRSSWRFPSLQTTSLLIGLGLLVGLEHPIRRRIYDHLSRLPGDHLRSVARSLRLAVGTARYHIDALLRDGLIYKRQSNGRSRYYVAGGAAEVNRLYARHWEYRDVRLRIVDALRRLEAAPPASIAKVLGVSRQLVSYHLGVLEKSGIVRREGAEYHLVNGAHLEAAPAEA